MPAPPNDNFVAATVLNGNSGSIQASNLNSTAEFNEPANNGHTVWFVWTCPNNFPKDFVIFKTLDIPATLPQLASTMRAYFAQQGNVGTAIEQTYILAGNSRYAGFSLGSLIMLATTPGVPVWFRIDATPGFTSEGNFVLEWLPSDGLPMLGKCGDCLSDFSSAISCVDQFSGPDLTTGDVRSGLCTAVNRKIVTYPAGKYMFRYCTGYYVGPNGLYTIAAIGLLFCDNVGAGLTFSMSPTLLQAGDLKVTVAFSSGTAEADVFYTVAFYTGASAVSTQLARISAQLNIETQAVISIGGSITTASPITAPKSQVINPGEQIIYNGGPTDPRAPTEFTSPGKLAQTFNCDAQVFDHTGGEMNWIFAIGFNPIGALPPDGIGLPIATLLNGQYQLGPAGPPTFALMKVLPQISLAAAVTCVYQDNPTPNGEKLFIITVELKNAGNAVWANVAITPSGFPLNEDATPYLPFPGPTNLAANANTIWQILFNMTKPTGVLTLKLTDVLNTVYPVFNINFTPLFSVVLQITNLNVLNNGILCNIYGFKIVNIGNCSTSALICTITATVNGAPIQLALIQPGQPNAPFQDSIQFEPYFGRGNGGPTLGWDPGIQANANLYVKLTAQPQNIVFNLAFADTGAVIPSAQITEIAQPHP